MNDIFLDTNCVMQILFKREGYEKILKILEEFDKAVISMLSVHLIFHFGIKADNTLEELGFFLEQFRILDFCVSDYKLAKDICKGLDFEDALQIATSLNNNLKTVFSLDEKMKKRYGNLVSFVGV